MSEVFLITPMSKERALLAQALGVLGYDHHGAARACRFAGVSFLELRAVTDVADKSAPVDFERHLALAMASLARLLPHWLQLH